MAPMSRSSPKVQNVSIETVAPDTPLTDGVGRGAVHTGHDGHFLGLRIQRVPNVRVHHFIAGPLNSLGSRTQHGGDPRACPVRSGMQENKTRR
jgi:hypothetical protein